MLIESYINRLLSHFFLQSHIVTRSKGININNTSMTKDFVVNQRRKLGATQPKSDMATGRSIK